MTHSRTLRGLCSLFYTQHVYLQLLKSNTGQRSPHPVRLQPGEPTVDPPFQDAVELFYTSSTTLVAARFNSLVLTTSDHPSPAVASPQSKHHQGQRFFWSSNRSAKTPILWTPLARSQIIPGAGCPAGALPTSRDYRRPS